MFPRILFIAFFSWNHWVFEWKCESLLHCFHDFLLHKYWREKNGTDILLCSTYNFHSIFKYCISFWTFPTHTITQAKVSKFIFSNLKNFNGFFLKKKKKNAIFVFFALFPWNQRPKWRRHVKKCVIQLLPFTTFIMPKKNCILINTKQFKKALPETYIYRIFAHWNLFLKKLRLKFLKAIDKVHKAAKEGLDSLL